jgi:class 3 adenylate cyclase
MLYLGVRPADLKFDGDSITIPNPGAGVIRIPVRAFHSDALARDIPATMDVPWFGTSHWETMYDWPAHSATKQHVSMNVVWEPCLIRRKIATNNRTLDKALVQFQKVFGLPPSPKLPDDDFAGRLTLADQILNSDDFKTYLKTYQEMAPKELDDDGRAYLSAAADLQTIKRENTLQLSQLALQRAKVRAALNGKAALVGFTATGNEDAVATSIHGRCPGVIAHGVVFNSILTGQFWRALPRSINYLLTAILGLLTALIAGRLNWGMAFLVVAAIAVTFLLFNGLYLFDNHNLLLDLATPLITLGVVWSACSAVRIYMETIERKRVERKFRSYVDPAVVNYVMERGELPIGESRELTVCFGDLAGFTSLSERLGERTVEMLNRLWDRMVPILRENDGRLDKFLGDGIMFFFGAPKPDPDHASKAVRTALEMQNALSGFNEELKAQHLPTLQMRIGINTGLMVVGDAGSTNPKASNYTVLGDAVNFASRLESANKYTGTSILISARTAQLCGDQFLLRPVGALQVVGKVEAVLTFEVCGLADAADEKQKNLCDHSRELVDSFRDRKFEIVLKLVDQLDKTHGPSPLTELYRELSESYLRNPPEHDFDGRIEFEKK